MMKLPRWIPRADWLSERVKESLPQPPDHKLLNNRKVRFLRYVNDAGKWWLVLVVVCILSFLGLIDFTSLNFLPPINEPEKIIQDRLNLFIGIFSVSVAVIIFLVQAIQQRNVGVDISALVFRESWVYPILYFALSSMSCTLLVLYFKDFLETHTLHLGIFSIAFSVAHFSGMQLVLFICLIFFIGFLFSTVYRLTNTDYLFKLYLEDLQRVAEAAIAAELKMRRSREIFTSMMEEIGYTFKNHLLDLIDNSQLIPINPLIDSPFIITDIRLDKLKRVKSKIQTGEFVSTTALCFESPPYQPIFWVSADTPENVQKKIARAFKVELLSDSSIDYENRFLDLKNRITKALRDNDSITLSRILTAFYSINESVAISLDNYSVEKTSNDFPNSLSRHDFWAIIENIYFFVLDVFKEAIKNNNVVATKAICEYSDDTLQLAFRKNLRRLFRLHSYLPVHFYQIAWKNASVKSDIKDKARNDASYLFNVIDYSIPQSLKDASNKLPILDFRRDIFSSINDLLKSTMDFGDVEGFEKFIERLNYVRPLFPDKIDEDKQETIIGVRAWLWHLYKVDKINLPLLKSFTDILRHDDNDELEIPVMINKWMFFQHQGDGGCFNWRDWDIVEHTDGKIYEPLSPLTWLNFAYVLMLLQQQPYVFYNIREVKPDERLFRIPDIIKNYCDEIKKNTDKWLPVLEIENAAELESRIQIVEKAFQELQVRQQRIMDDYIIHQPISSEKILETKTAVQKRFKNAGKVRRAFETFNAPKLTEDKNGLVPQVQSVNFPKDNFIEKIHLPSSDRLSYLGETFSIQEDNDFITAILATGNTSHSANNSIATSIEDACKRLEERNIQPSLIFLGGGLFWDLNSSLQDQVTNSLTQAKLSNIHIVSFHPRLFKGRAIVCDFERAFKMIQYRNPENPSEQLQINITEIDEARAKQIVNSLDLLNDSNGNPISEEDAIRNLMLQVEVTVTSAYKFEIKDSSAFEIISFNPPPAEPTE